MFGNDDSQMSQFFRVADNVFKRRVNHTERVSAKSITRSELLDNDDLKTIVFARG